jgi:hypothetical protein
MVACALKELGHDVRVYTDRRPPFLGDFVYYQNPPINLVRLVNSVDVKADLYFGMPVGGTVAAAACARKYKKRAFCFVFDPLPVMQRFGRSARSADMQPQYWRRMLSAMKWEGAIPISLAECWVEDINEWVEKDNTTWLYPAVNSRVLDRVAKRPRRNALVWTSRIVPRGCEGYVNFQPACSDNKKFQLLRSSRGGILPSQFEGFGISVIEALESGVPFVCYEFPTYREIADKVGYGVYLATFKNRNSLRQKLVWALENGPIKPPRMFRFENMCERLEALMEEFA